MVKLEWTSKAIDDLNKLDSLIVQRILRKVTWFADNFEKITPEPLTGDLKGMFKLRIGDWRVVYHMEGTSTVIHFVGHRKEIYETK